MMQEIKQMKKLLTALALATLAASPAFAASRHSHVSTTATASDSYAAAEVENGNNSYASGNDPDVVISDGVYAGRDPDPNVRAQLRRDPGLPAN
jgi:hypothetical protein